MTGYVYNPEGEVDRFLEVTERVAAIGKENNAGASSGATETQA